MSTDRTAEILKYMSAMSRDIGEFRTETRAQIGRLQTQISELRVEMHTQVGELRTGLDEVRTGLDEGRIGLNELRTEMRTGFSELRKEVRALTNGLARFQARILETHADVDDLDIRVSALEGKQE